MLPQDEMGIGHYRPKQDNKAQDRASVFLFTHLRIYLLKFYLIILFIWFIIEKGIYIFVVNLVPRALLRFYFIKCK